MDSHGRYIQNFLERYFCYCKVIFKSGAHIDFATHNVRTLTPREYSYVLLHIGTNNFFTRSKREKNSCRKILDDLESLITETHSPYFKSTILFSAILPKCDFDLYNDRVRYVNRKLKERTSHLERFIFVPHEKCFITKTTSRYKSFKQYYHDDTHLNMDGLQIMTDHIISTL